MAGTVAGRELATRRSVTLARGALRFPRPAVAAPPLPAGSDLHIPGLSSFITPNSTFYRVDTALLLPQVDPSTWQLRIHGMVQREITITFAELLRRPLIEAYVTLTCVSDPVGGPYVGNAKWLGARLADLIRQARPRAGVQFGRMAAPFAVAHILIHAHQLARNGDQQPDRLLGNFDRVAACGITDDQTVVPGGLKVHSVHADTGARDDFRTLELRNDFTGERY